MKNKPEPVEVALTYKAEVKLDKAGNLIGFTVEEGGVSKELDPEDSYTEDKAYDLTSLISFILRYCSAIPQQPSKPLYTCHKSETP